MKKNKYLRRAIGLAAIAFAMITMLCGQAFAYAGNVYISKNIVGTPYLISDGSPVTSGTHTLKTADNMPAGSNYVPIADVTLGDGTHWYKFNIIDTSASSVYVLLVDGAKYSLNGAYALGTTKPEDHYLASAVFYESATPPAPTASLTLIGLTYPTFEGIVNSGIGPVAAGYEQNGTKYRLYEVTGGANGGTDGTLGASPIVSGGGGLSNYTIANSSNKMYRLQMAYVNYFTDNNEIYGDSTNLLIPAAGMGSLGEILLDLYKSATPYKLGINQFQFSLDPVKTIKYSTSKTDSTPSVPLTDKTVKGLVKAINAYAIASGAAGPIVQTIGWWKASNPGAEQKMQGYIVTGSADNPTFTGSEAALVDGSEALTRYMTYQVSVSEEMKGLRITDQ